MEEELEKSLKKYVALINQFHEGHLTTFVNRIVRELNNQEKFQHDEMLKLQKVFNLSHQELKDLVHAFTSSFKVIAFYGTKPVHLQSCLERLGINSELSLLIAKAWSDNSRQLISEMREKSSNAPRLKDIRWKTGVTASSSSASEQNIGTGLLELKLENSNTAQIEFDKSSLKDFYDQLEKIQGRLDLLQ
ncbi:DgyrCDS12579 [Dimorphilus gyrociliatus]|uniref:DgyrCDS12579 n=1 Tax=Dimorphilus gyrociliatus TaxID=2664684 RepID=A0A7I8W8L9_9ANNE|nr:DgyrCDS12579 [Dimorphilus gyrociliatus]